MIWQDIVIAAVVSVFTLTTIPLIRSGVRVPLMTAVPMVLGSALLVLCYITLSLWLSVVIEVLATLLWASITRRTLAS
jgi:hypothetical protein